MTTKNTNYTTFFGGSKLSILDPCTHELNITHASAINRHLASSTMFLARQVHSATVLVAPQQTQLHSPVIWVGQGDALITNQSKASIGIITADCLPLLLYDSKNHAAAAVHAGWRGAVAGIVDKTLLRLKQAYGTDARDLIVYLGPCANVCCYEVRDDFVEQLDDLSSVDKRDGRFYFDQPRYATKQLRAHGVHTINIDALCCTMCVSGYNSHRAQKGKAGRNLTAICLKELL